MRLLNLRNLECEARNGCHWRLARQCLGCSRAGKLPVAHYLCVVTCVSILLHTPPAAAFPWSIDMFRGPTVQPLAVPPRTMPAGTFPTQGGEPSMTREAAANSLQNPVSPTAAALHNGADLFATHCAVCHGPVGKGDSPVAARLHLTPPDLATAHLAARTDGYLYAFIRNGSSGMPALGDAMSPIERWQVVLYLRQLQGKENLP